MVRRPSKSVQPAIGHAPSPLWTCVRGDGRQRFARANPILDIALQCRAVIATQPRAGGIIERRCQQCIRRGRGIIDVHPVAPAARAGLASACAPQHRLASRAVKTRQPQHAAATMRQGLGFCFQQNPAIERRGQRGAVLVHPLARILRVDSGGGNKQQPRKFQSIEKSAQAVAIQRAIRRFVADIGCRAVQQGVGPSRQAIDAGAGRQVNAQTTQAWRRRDVPPAQAEHVHAAGKATFSDSGTEVAETGNQQQRGGIHARKC